MQTTHETFQLRREPGTFQEVGNETHGINVNVQTDWRHRPAGPKPRVETTHSVSK